MDLRELYQELILDHGKHPRNFRKPETHTHEAAGHNPLCGDKLVLFLTLDNAGCVTDISFQGTGCAISTASASIMTDVLKGKTQDQAEALFSYFHAAATGAPLPDITLDADDMARLDALSGVKNFPVRVKCATLAWHTLHAALHGEKSTSTEGA